MSTVTATSMQPDLLRQSLLRHGLSWIDQLDYFGSISSTNDHLMKLDGPIHGRLCVADYQTRGKGRLGRQWQSSRGQNLMFSLGWAPQDRPGPQLSLVVGLAIAEALQAAGLPEVALKWPNDVLYKGEKLAGILIESKILGSCVEFVIGVGLNIAQQAEDLAAVDNAWADLSGTPVAGLSRQDWLLAILLKLDARLAQFQQQGFAGLCDDWQSYHLYQGKELSYMRDDQQYIGRVVGLSEGGGLQLEADGRVVTVLSGEVNTLRLQS